MQTDEEHSDYVKSVKYTDLFLKIAMLWKERLDKSISTVTTFKFAQAIKIRIHEAHKKYS